VAHVYSPSYSGGRDLEDHSLKPAWANISMRGMKGGEGREMGREG
jgi:hypothetical protein